MVFSTFIVDIHLKLINRLREEYEKMNLEIPNEFGYIENFPDVYNAVQKHLKSLNEWAEWDRQKRMEIIDLIIKPYQIKQSSMEAWAKNG